MVKLTQGRLAEKADVTLTLIRKIEQGKENLNIEKANQLLKLFGNKLEQLNRMQPNPIPFTINKNSHKSMFR